MALSEKKKEEFMRQMAEELFIKYDTELYKACLDIGTEIYKMAKSYNEK